MKRPTWILLFVFLALAGLFVYLDRKEKAPQDDPAIETEPVSETQFLFGEENGIPINLVITDTAGNTVELARNDAGAWVLNQPVETEAEQGTAEAAMSQLTTLRILSTLELAPADAGLVPPSYLVTVDFSSGETFIIEIGDETPTNTGYYARKLESDGILVISKPGLDALLTLLANPPYLNPPTKSPEMEAVETAQPE